MEIELELKQVSSELKIPNNISLEALRLYRNHKNDQKFLTERRSLMAGSLLVALRVNRNLTPTEKVAKAFNENIMKLGLASHVICRAEGIDNSQLSIDENSLKVAVDMIGRNLDLYGYTIDDAEKIIIKAYTAGIKSKNRYFDVAGASILIASEKNGERITLQDVTRVSKTDSEALFEKVNEIKNKL